MIKLIDNAQRDVSFAFANEVARLCDTLGISATEVIESGKLGYPRTNLPMPGPVGGPCLEKDTYILAESVADYGLEPDIALTARRLNENQPDEVIAQVRQFTNGITDFPDTPNITVAGVALKGRPATDDVRGTMAIPIIKAIRANYPDAQLRGYDAMVSDDEIAGLGLQPISGLDAAFDGAHLVIVANNHRCFGERALLGGLAKMARPGMVYDFWNNIRPPYGRIPENTWYLSLGSLGLSQPGAQGRA